MSKFIKDNWFYILVIASFSAVAMLAILAPVFGGHY